jgi:hypothetical protein
LASAQPIKNALNSIPGFSNQVLELAKSALASISNDKTVAKAITKSESEAD